MEIHPGVRMVLTVFFLPAALSCLNQTLNSRKHRVPPFLTGVRMIINQLTFYCKEVKVGQMSVTKAGRCRCFLTV